jgi:sorting nexin-1/2/sorting nexin-4
VKRWPGCYIPSLPSKVKLTHSDEEFLETRSKYLQKFLLEVARKPFLWESDVLHTHTQEMQIFLRNDMMDLEKVVAPLWKIDPADLLYRYNSRFASIPTEGAM